MKLCKDCVHSTELERCQHPKNMKIDYYSGKQEVGKSGFVFCTTLRGRESANQVFWCGPSANHFEQRPIEINPQPQVKPRRWWEFWKR